MVVLMVANKSLVSKAALFSFFVYFAGNSNTFTYTRWGYRNLTTGITFDDPTNYASDYGFIPETSGQYEIYVRPMNECGIGPESVKALTVNEVCSFGDQQYSIAVFPNPTTGNVKVKIPKKINKNGILQLINQFGMIVYTQKVNAKTETLEIDMSKLKRGIYQLSLNTGNESRNAKIIKQ